MFLLKFFEFLRKKMTGRFCRLKLAYLFVMTRIIPADRQLLKYRNIHKGERCFCIGTAPSLTAEDIEAMRGQYTFSCNSIVNYFKSTDWRPTYFVLFDPYFYSLYHEVVDKIEVEELFYNRIQIPKIGRSGVAVKGSPEHLVREYMKRKKDAPKPKLPLSTDLMKKLVIGQSTIHSALALAAWMGFSEICLLGVDCDYSSGQHSALASDERLSSGALDAREMVQDFRDYKEQFEALGIRVINCSRGNKLNVFDYVPLDEVLATPVGQNASYV